MLVRSSPSVISGRSLVRRVARIDKRKRRPGDRAQLDRDDVVEDPPAVREPGEVASDDPERVRVARRRRDRHVQPQLSASVVPVKFWKPGTIPDGMPVSRIATRSRARRGERPRGSGTRPGTERAAARRARGAARPGGTACRRRAASAFHRSLPPIGTSTSLNSGLPRRETWTQSPASCTEPRLRLADRRGLPARGRPHADDRARVASGWSASSGRG